MAYVEQIRTAKLHLEEAVAQADAAGDDWAAAELHQAIAWCRNAELMAVMRRAAHDGTPPLNTHYVDPIW